MVTLFKLLDWSAGPGAQAFYIDELELEDNNGPHFPWAILLLQLYDSEVLRSRISSTPNFTMAKESLSATSNHEGLKQRKGAMAPTKSVVSK